MSMRLIVFLLSMVLAAGPLRAGPLASVEADYARADVFADRTGFVPGETTEFAIRMAVAPAWHVFWKNPGDAGLPLSLDWYLPDGFRAGAIAFPAPSLIPVGPLASYAHEGAPIFRVAVAAPDDVSPGETVRVRLDAAWQTCRDICVPEEASFAFDMPVLARDEAGVANAPLFAEARAAAPAAFDGEAVFERAGDAYRLILIDWRAPQGAGLFFFPETEGLTTPAAPQNPTFRNGRTVLTLTPGWTAPEGEAVRGVLKAGAASFALSAPVREAAPGLAAPAGAVRSGTGNAAGLVFLAFVGGLILNAMPCVFPILFVKAASLVEAAHHERAVALRHAGLYAAGVLAAFLAMGGALLLVRAAGEGVGWGFHLQSPVVVGLSALTLYAVGLNLAGVFSLGQSLAGAGTGLAGRGGGLGAFFTGVLAVAVAAPCIGPLLTAPMGAALTQGPMVSLAIFAALGLGLAAPFVAVTAIPAIAQRLPRPGPWMAVFRQALSFPVFAGAAFFVWVFARQTGDGALAGMLAALVALALAAWLFEKSRGEGARALFGRVMAALALGAALLPVLSAAPTSPSRGAEGAVAGDVFSREALARHRGDGRPVFVDFTAAWCVTCQVNKLTVLQTRDVAEAFTKSGTVLLTADWTLRDPAITEALEGFGAAGVPLYVYFPPDGEPRVLPQILSRKIVIDALTAGQGRVATRGAGADSAAN